MADTIFFALYSRIQARRGMALLQLNPMSAKAKSLSNTLTVLFKTTWTVRRAW